MTCSICQKDANDNPVAYYFVGERRICWLCLSPAEKLERDGIVKDPRRFKMDKTIKETTQ